MLEDKATKVSLGELPIRITFRKEYRLSNLKSFIEMGKSPFFSKNTRERFWNFKIKLKAIAQGGFSALLSASVLWDCFLSFFPPRGNSQ